jgi:transaldolase
VTNNFRKLAELGQSLWFDNIRRGLIVSGELQALIDEGVRGVTSNPTIFQKAIGQSDDYDDALRELVAAHKGPTEIYEALVLDDIGRAADLFRPLYDHTEGRDGFVSIEVEPALAYDTEATITRARQLFRTLRRPNVMIKVPGTEAGLPAIRTLIGEGVNVNVTLIFSVDVYQQVIDAYLGGLLDYLNGGGDPARVASVASFFVSRVDTAVDKQLAARIDAGQTELESLLGQAAVANTKVAYAQYRESFSGDKFAALRARGGRTQRPLWASTSTKNPAYRDTLYVDTLIGPDTVNTAPPVTLEAIRKLESVEVTLERDLEGARATLARIEQAGIRMAEVTEELRTAGVKAFADSFDRLIADVERKAGRIRKG